MTRNIKLTIEYDGTHFYGWQIQILPKRTVQGELEKALARIFKRKIKVTGSGRTDSGVHAVGQVANFKVQTPMPVDVMKKAINAHLPADVAIVGIEEVPLKFHARYSVKSKTYHYTILNRDVRSPRLRHTCLLYPYKLNLPLMRAEARDLIGRKDFKSFQSADPAQTANGRTTIRTIKRVNIKKRGDFIDLEIEADGFLYKMVRNIAGTLLQIASGRLPKGSIQTILSKRNRVFAAKTAKAHGLTLVNVKYGKDPK